MPGVDCFIQNYFDHDPGYGWQDYACGALTYNAHTGTDFRLVDLQAMNAGVAVLAAARGTVVAVRDGEPDILASQRGRSSLRGKEAGNGVRIDHGDGWETQYSHLKAGSVAVQPGQRVEAGDVIGQVGLSGNTDFPHVDFTVRKDGKPIDPFSSETSGCGHPDQQLWDKSVAARLNYRPSGLLMAGFGASPLTREQADTGEFKKSVVALDSQAIVFWFELFGLRQGDVLTMELASPLGLPLAANRNVADGNKAVWFGFIGKKRTSAVWQTGRYRGRITLQRGTETIIDETRFLELR